MSRKGPEVVKGMLDLVEDLNNETGIIELAGW